MSVGPREPHRCFYGEHQLRLGALFVLTDSKLNYNTHEQYL